MHVVVPKSILVGCKTNCCQEAIVPKVGENLEWVQSIIG